MSFERVGLPKFEVIDIGRPTSEKSVRTV